MQPQHEGPALRRRVGAGGAPVRVRARTRTGGLVGGLPVGGLGDKGVGPEHVLVVGPLLTPGANVGRQNTLIS